MFQSVSNTVSTITSKWQVTIPEEVRKEIPLKIGERIAWEVAGDKLVGRRVRSITELAGCLKRKAAPINEKEFAHAFAEAAVARHNRISRQKG